MAHAQRDIPSGKGCIQRETPLTMAEPARHQPATLTATAVKHAAKGKENPARRW